MPKRKLNDKTLESVKEYLKRMNIKPNSPLMEIKDKKDRVAGHIIECMSGSTWQEMMDQLDFVKDFLMNRIVMTRISYDGYLERQKKGMDFPAKPKNDKTENNKVETSPASTGTAAE